jgi:hypothetical protein
MFKMVRCTYILLMAAFPAKIFSFYMAPETATFMTAPGVVGQTGSIWVYIGHDPNFLKGSFFVPTS